jgi:hypothetical protein
MALHRVRGILNIDRNNTVSVTTRANAMATGFTNFPSVFVNPSPTPAAITSQVATVGKAEVVAETRAKGTAGARNVQRDTLVGLLEVGLTYAQGLADNCPTTEGAMNVIVSAGLVVASVGQRVKGILNVKQGPVSGSVVLDAFARVLRNGKRGGFFNWQSTADGGKTFVTLPPTAKAKTSVANLAPLQTYGFRVAVTMPDGITGDWSQVVVFLVH